MKYLMESCGGCRTCELACSYVMVAKFKPDASFMKVIVDNELNRYIEFPIEELERNQAIPCERCFSKTDEPMCLQFCNKEIDLLNILKTFLMDAKAYRERQNNKLNKS